MKYSTISGATPSIPLSDNHEDGTWLPTDLYIGEFFTNAADDTFWIRTDNGISQLFGGTGGSASFIGDFVHISGGTFSGVVYAPTFSANYLVGTTINGTTITADYFIGGTYSGDGSLLTGIVSDWLGGTISNPSYFTNTVDFSNTISFDGLIQTNNIEFSFDNNINVNGYASASIFYGDGSGLTNLPTGTYSDTFTIGATLSSNTIIFSRNDGGDYNIDLSPILDQQSIATITWDDTIDELLITFNDASTIGLTINNFSQVSSTGPITSPEFYGGVFYGEFVGTYSNDIYTTSATLAGTTAIFDRTDGVTYSLDLSSLSGGGTGSAGTLEQTLALGNTTGVYDIIVDNSSEIVFGTASGLLFNNTSRLREGTIDAGYGGNKGIAQICAVGYEMKWESGSLYIMNGDGTQIREVRYTFGATPSTSSDVTKGFIVGSRWILDNGDLYTCSDNTTASAVWNLSSTGVGSLEQTLAIGNTTGTYSILSPNNSGLSNYNGVQGSKGITFDNDAVIMYAGTSSLNDGGPLGFVSVLNVDGTISIQTQGNVEYNMNYLGAGSGTFNVSGYTGFKGIEYASDYSGSYSVRSLVDKGYVDNLVALGATGLGGVLAIDNQTGGHNINLNATDLIISDDGEKTIEFEATRILIQNQDIANDATGFLEVLNNTSTSQLAHVYDDGAGNVVTSAVQVTDNTASITSTSEDTYVVSNQAFVRADSGYGMSPLAEVRIYTEDAPGNLSYMKFNPGNIEVTGYSSDGFGGIEYGSDYSADYSNRSLVDKEYVDIAVGASSTLEQTLILGNYIGTQSINFGGETNLYAQEDGLGTHTFIVNAIGLTQGVDPGFWPTFEGVNSYIKMTNDLDGIRLDVTKNDGIVNKVNRISTSVGSIGIQSIDLIDTLSADITQTPTNILSTVTDNGYQKWSSTNITTDKQQNQFSPSGYPQITVTDDKRGGCMQTTDNTTTLIIYCDMDPAITDTSIVQIKAHVRGISSDKMLGYAAEITSWVRVNPAALYPVTQIGVVDYIIKSEFATASSSFVISGPNMYIDVTGETGKTIDWTCNVELLYDKNTF